MAASKILAICGGVGGAKLALGLTRALPPEQLAIVVNTGDDFTHLGLHVSPDIDTVMYTLSDLANPETGWGRRDESWNFLDAIGQLGGETWFRLGDRDIATHVERTRRLTAGETLSDVTAALCQAVGIRHPVAPMSDQPLRTVLHTDEGVLPFQDYFVRRRAEPVVRGIEFAHARTAHPSPAFRSAMADPDLAVIIICPSNPWLSVLPILSVPGARDMLAARRCPVIAVSPIVAGQALKGPAARLMEQLGHVASATEVARFYGDLLDGFVLDEQDEGLVDDVEKLGVAVTALPTIMTDLATKTALAHAVLDFAKGVTRPGS